MIGAIMARRQARATFARLNAHDLEGFVRAIADDVVIVPARWGRTLLVRYSRRTFIPSS